MKFKKDAESGDPSSIQQSFEKIKIDVHCCRYWWLKRWRHQRLSYPYWHLYWNRIEGASVYYEEKISLGPDKIILISPHTPFSTNIYGDLDNKLDDYCLEGGWINSPRKEEKAREMGYIPHLFIHFNLGYIFDNTNPAVYFFDVDNNLRESIEKITGMLKAGIKNFGYGGSLEINSLISQIINIVPVSTWGKSQFESRVLRVMDYVQRHLDEELNNDSLADMVNMAPNSFARHFKKQTGQAPQSFIRKLRVEDACRRLHHSEVSISKIAEECGFSDRYYFTKVFTRETKVSPAMYRKRSQITLGS